MKRLRLRPLAELDIDGAALHYADAGGVELGLRFLDAVEATFDRLRELPLTGHIHPWSDARLTGVRRTLVGPPFRSFAVFYRVTDDDAIEVMRLLHGARDLTVDVIADTDT